VEQWAEIRRMHFVERLSIKEIHRRTGRDRKTIRRAVSSAEPPRYRRVRRPSKLDPFRDEIDRLLRSDPRLPGKRIRELIEEFGYEGSKTILDDYLRELRPRYLPRRAYQRTLYRPGELLQFDLLVRQDRTSDRRQRWRLKSESTHCKGEDDKRRACQPPRLRDAAGRLILESGAFGSKRLTVLGLTGHAGRDRRPGDVGTSTWSKTRSGTNDGEADSLLLRAVADDIGGNETRSKLARVQPPPTYPAAESPRVAPGCALLGEAPHLAIEDAARPSAVDPSPFSALSPDPPAAGPSADGDTDLRGFGELVMEGSPPLRRRGVLLPDPEAAG
jgi:transposase